MDQDVGVLDARDCQDSVHESPDEEGRWVKSLGDGLDSITQVEGSDLFFHGLTSEAASVFVEEDCDPNWCSY